MKKLIHLLVCSRQLILLSVLSLSWDVFALDTSPIHYKEVSSEFLENRMAERDIAARTYLTLAPVSDMMGAVAFENNFDETSINISRIPVHDYLDRLGEYACASKDFVQEVIEHSINQEILVPITIDLADQTYLYFSTSKLTTASLHDEAKFFAENTLGLLLSPSSKCDEWVKFGGAVLSDKGPGCWGCWIPFNTCSGCGRPKNVGSDEEMYRRIDSLLPDEEVTLPIDPSYREFAEDCLVVDF